MPKFVPTLFKGESLYSWLARWGLRSGMPSKRIALKYLIGENHLQLMSLLPSYAGILANLSGLSVKQLINEHSALPYWQLFTSRETFKSVRSDMAQGDTHTAYSRLSIIASRVCEPRVIRYCPLCCSNDVHSHGVAFWHTEHQLPGVTACCTHQVKLISVKRSRSSLILPPQLHHTPHIALATKTSVKLAQLSRELLSSDFQHLDNERLIYAYKVRLAEKGYASESLNVRQLAWRTALENYWSELLPDVSVNSVFSLGKNQQFPTCMTRGLASNHHPLKHLLMIGAQFESVNDFIRFYQGAEITHQKVIERNTLRVNTKQLEAKQEKEQQALSKLKAGHSLRQVAKELGGSISTFKHLAIKNGVEVNRRAQKLFEQQRHSIWKQLVDGKTTQKIATNIGCSNGAVEQELHQYPELLSLRARIRFLSKRSEHREKLISTKNRFEKPTRKQIQDAARSAYTWLFKHDKQWLYTQLPAAIPRNSRRTSRNDTHDNGNKSTS